MFWLVVVALVAFALFAYVSVCSTYFLWRGCIILLSAASGLSCVLLVMIAPAHFSCVSVALRRRWCEDQAVSDCGDDWWLW